MIGKILLKFLRKFSLSRLNSYIINANYIFDSSHFCSQLKLLHQNTFGRLIITSISSFSVCLHETMSDKTSRFQPVDARSISRSLLGTGSRTNRKNMANYLKSVEILSLFYRPENITVFSFFYLLE